MIPGNSKQERFGLAVKHGDIEAVKSLIVSEDVDVHAFDEWAFHRACENGDTAMVRFLLQWCVEHTSIRKGVRPVNIHMFNDHAFRWACHNGHTQTARFLLQWSKARARRGAHPVEREINVHAMNENAFRLACANGHTDTARFLLQCCTDRHQINVHAWDEHAFRFACGKGHIETCRFLIEWCGFQRQQGEGRSPIDIHAWNNHAFFWACSWGHPTAPFLVQRCAMPLEVKGARQFLDASRCAHLVFVALCLRATFCRAVFHFLDASFCNRSRHFKFFGL